MPQPKSQPEMTLKAVALGLFLALVFGAANAYLGMKAGQTVAATIPAAVIAMALFRLPAFRGGILEQNIARTAGSVGEALVAGAIFTIPAFLMVEINGVRLWSDLRSHYWQASLILLVGGLIGIFFIVLLRRALCVEAGLPFPESVASYEIVPCGPGIRRRAALHFRRDGLRRADSNSEGSARAANHPRVHARASSAFPRSVVRHFNFDKQPIGEVTHFGGIQWSTPSLSPALIGIGYIIGPELSAVNFSGGVLAWWIFIPLLLFFDPDLPRRIGSTDPSLAAYTLWFNIVRPIAVGTMLVGAAKTMWGMRASLAQSLKGAFAASTRAAHEEQLVERTERDIPAKWILPAIAVLLVPIAFIYYFFTGGWMPAIVAALVMSVTGFVLSAVGGYLVGHGGQLEPAAVGADAVGAADLGAADGDHRRHGPRGRGRGAGRGGAWSAWRVRSPAR